jgi:predicted transposase YbfD/YdcC
MDEPVPSLRAVLAQVPDPRATRGRRHPWTALLLLLVAARLSGATTQQAMARWGQHAGWPRLRRLGFTRRGGPSAATVRRLLHRVDVPALERVFGAWQQQVRTAWQQRAAHWLDGIAVDGKSLRGARRLGAVDARLLSACCHRRGLVLGEVAVPESTNELGAVGSLLERLQLQDQTVTFDAEFTHAVVASQVVHQGGAYLLLVKANQPPLRRACAEATAEHPRHPRRALGQARTRRLAHGRLEARTLLAVAAPPDLGFPFVRQVLRLHRRRIDKRTGEVLTDETVSAVTSLGPEQATPQQVLHLWQAHWTIETGEHWVRDVVFGEDRATTHTAHAPQALAAFRNLAIALIHLWRGSAITAAREYFGAHPAALVRRLDLPAARL